MRKDTARNREAILRAAQSRYEQDGSSLGMHDVARDAGVGIGTLYRHFRSREDLLEGVAVMGLKEVVDTIALTTPESDARTALSRLLRGLGELGCDPVLERFVRQPATEEVQKMLASFWAALTQFLSSAQEAGEIAPDVTVEEFVGLLHGFLASVQAAPDQTRALDRFPELFIAGIAAK